MKAKVVLLAVASLALWFVPDIQAEPDDCAGLTGQLGCLLDDPEIVCVGVFRPPTEVPFGDLAGAAGYVDYGEGVTVVGVAIADGGRHNAPLPGSHTSFVVVGGATSADWCSDNAASDNNVGRYWADGAVGLLCPPLCLQ